jgi:hypothetical protein
MGQRRGRPFVFEIVEAIHKALRTESTFVFVLVIVSVFAVMGGIVGWLVDAGYKNSPEYRAAHATPIVEVSYELKQDGLPIPIQAHTSIPITFVRPDRTVETVDIINSSDKQYLWPLKQTPKAEGLGLVTFSNHGKVTAFDISAAVNFKIGAENDPGGIIDVMLKLPLIGTLKAGDSSSPFYVVNQSSYVAMVELPDNAAMQIQGENERRQISLPVRNVTFFDRMPLMLPPTDNKWKAETMLKQDSK